MRVLVLSHLNGRSTPARGTRGGEVQRLSIPGGGQLLTAPAVWRRGGHTTMFVADENGTGAYVMARGRLSLAWQNGTPGTSPVMAGGLLYVYDPSGGGIYVYRPRSPRPIAKLPGSSGHWNSPIVVDGHVVEPVGNANDHRTSGALEVFTAG
jgi:PQQ-like domain